MKPIQPTWVVALGVIYIYAPFAYAQCAGSLLLNGGFEDETAGVLDDWQTSTPSPAAQNDGVDPEIVARVGTGFLRFQDAGVMFVEQTLTIPSAPSAEFQLFAKAIGAGTGTIRVLIDAAEVLSIDISEVLADATGANGYTATAFTVDISAAADGAEHTVRIEGETGDAATILLVDDACLTIASAVATGPCPPGAVTLVTYGDFEPIPPATCPDPVQEANILGAWDATAPAVVVTCEDPPVNGNGGSGGYGHFPLGMANGDVRQGDITMSGQAGSAFLTFWVKMPTNVAEGETFKVFLRNQTTDEEFQLWPLETLTAAELRELYNDIFGSGEYEQIITVLQGLTNDPDDYELRFEREGAAEFFLDDVCVYGGGGFCLSNDNPDVTVTSSNPNAEIGFVGSGATALITLDFRGAGQIGACASGFADFGIRTEAGTDFPINDYLVYADPQGGIIQFRVDIDTLTDNLPIDGLTHVLINGIPDPDPTDQFTIDTVAPVVAPGFVPGQTYPVSAMATLDLPRFTGQDFIASTNDTSVATVPGMPAGVGPLPAITNPLLSGYTYTPANDPFPPDNRLLSYATTGAGPAKVFFNVVQPLTVGLRAPFYDPPLLGPDSLPLSVAGFNDADFTNYTVLIAGTPLPVTVTSNYGNTPGLTGNFIIGHWQNTPELSFPTSPNAPGGPNSSRTTVSLTFSARDRAGNVTTTSPFRLDPVQLWWLAEARARIAPNWSGIEATPEQVYFDFSMDRAYDPLPTGGPLPIYTFQVFASEVAGAAGKGGPYLPFGGAYGGWRPWTNARRLTSLFFQEMLASDPLFAERDYLIVAVGADEAGNVQGWPLELTVAGGRVSIPGNAGANWQRFYLKGAGTALDTTISARFWHNRLDPLNDRFDGGTEVDLGSANILPYPADDLIHRLEVTFDVAGIFPPEAAGDLYVVLELEDVVLGQLLQPLTLGPLGRSTVRITFPYFFNATNSLTPERIFGRPDQVKEYVFRAAAQLRDASGAVIGSDPTPAVFRFRVVPGSVQDYLEDFTDPQAQPIREIQRIE
jgi:hypothetical protein